MKIKRAHVIRSRACDDDYDDEYAIYYGVGSAETMGGPIKLRSVSHAAHAALVSRRNPIGFGRP
jgi:hypothetical protein